MLHRLDRHVGVPVVRRADADDVDHRILDDVAEVGDRLAVRRKPRLRVSVVDLLRTGLAADLVAVAHGDDLDLISGIGLVQELRNERRAHLDAAADHRGTKLLARLQVAQADLRRRASGHRSSGGRTQKESSTIDVHVSCLRWGVCLY